MRYTDDDCLTALKVLAADLGKSPSWRDYLDSDMKPCGKVIKDRFGSWNRAKALAGLDTTDAGFDWREGLAPKLHMDTQGYERFWSDGKVITVHQLIAIAEYGFDDVAGKVVHHKNEIKWDNRPDNLEVMERDDHSRLHAQNQ